MRSFSEKSNGVSPESLERQAERLMEAAARLRARDEVYGDSDDWEDGTIFFFEKSLSGRHNKYSYAALKIGGRVYLTGATLQNPMPWTGFLDFVDGAELWVATTLERVG